MTFNSKDELLESITVIRDRFKNSSNKRVVIQSSDVLEKVKRSKSLEEASAYAKSFIEGILNNENSITGITEMKMFASGYGDDTDGDFDVDDAAKTLNDNAKSTYSGECAKYVREALEAGGIDTSGHPADAKDYGSFLEEKGFEEVDDADINHPEKGDIVVIQPNDDGSHPHGHIAMYDGKTWISDTKQRDYSAGLKGSYEVYRFSQKK